MQMIEKSKLPHVGTTIFTVMSSLAAAHKAINLSQGFPDFEPDKDLLEICGRKMKEGPHQYAPMAGSMNLRTQVGQLIKKKYGISLNPETEITITAGATQALFTAITALVHAGEEVIYFEPAYDCYEPAIRLQNAIPVPVRLQQNTFRPDWNEVESKINTRTRLIIINNPHNPCSSVLTTEDMKALDEICQRHPGIFVLSDEVYEHICFHEQGHQSVWMFPNLQNSSIQVSSFGKVLHATGWKIGYCAAPENIMREIRKVHQFNVFCFNHPMQEAIAEYMIQHPDFHRIEEMYRKKRDFFIEKIQSLPFRLYPCDGSYFLLAGYSEISSLSDKEFCVRMTQEAGVAIIPLSAFYHDGKDNRLVRFCFAKKESTLEEAAIKIRRWLERLL